MGNKIEIAKALAVTAELTATELSDMAMEAIVEDLAVYETAAVLKALNRCRRELSGRLTLAAVIERIDTGLPSADEAFGMLVEGWKNEALTVVVPEIAMKAAGNGAHELFLANDKTGARMAFRDAYQRFAADLQINGGAVKWFVSKGSDRNHQVQAVMEAVRLGRLKQDEAAKYLPCEAAEERLLLTENRLLTNEEKQTALKHTGKLLKLLKSKMVVQS
ncbi:hypothetical protein BWD09_07115 [Neisseria dentiae]|uniref:Uncharacterized protein n=1 Tax=Neisseria dentiae TaxID=194197 RepID=A0A1X3D9S3_9NEIS|nr:hypothetical protein [Neisseria dentiae]OSI16525.1 hypothetical protein BWD09_07115 [Neisseria dentiae]QMT44249.1 hypothetical protein H3L92_07065 [Neisseria dentiae]STZ49884.1 Uncharacterised protein [Neisseria dentiae]STZ49928.1 Uncharacterised protein [Neisseria dentiae]